MAKGGFRGGYGGGMNQAAMMKQAQKMQQEILKAQQEIEQSKFEFTAGGGAVKATVTGNHKLESLVIDPEALDPEDVEMLQDMIVSAVNGAMEQIEKKSEGLMGRFGGGLGGLF